MEYVFLEDTLYGIAKFPPLEGIKTEDLRPFYFFTIQASINRQKNSRIKRLCTIYKCKVINYLLFNFLKFDIPSFKKSSNNKGSVTKPMG